MAEGPRRNWFVTGAGRGLGRAFVEAALGAGDGVAATVRTPGALGDLRGEHGDRLHVGTLDVRERADVRRAVDGAIEALGGIDVVVNNAGFGLVGAIEEIGEVEAREIVDTDLLGALWVCQAVLPHLRRRGSGHIVQVSTVGAVGSMPTFGLYNAAKWGLEGFSEALAAEVAPFGIRVTIAEMGGFDTDWARSSMRFAKPSEPYDDIRTSIFGTSAVPWPSSDEPSGEPPPAAAAAALLAHVDRADGPLRLLVGDDAPEQVNLALAARRTDYERDPRFRWP